MTDAIITLNAGSSSIKFAIYDDDRGAAEKSRLVGKAVFRAGRTIIEAKKAGAPDETREISSDDFDIAVEEVFRTLKASAAMSEIRVVSHRIVHGGAKFATPQVMTPEIVSELERLTPLAPQHQPYGLKIANAARRGWPNAVQVAAFDTAFHRTTPRVEQLFALPRKFADEGVLRYGFHGLSYEYIASVAPTILGPEARRVIVAHLGHGCSLCAMLDGKSVATTMGFTALDGLPMATRVGAIDPGVLLHLLKERGLTIAELERCLYEESGLLGVSGISGDVRALEASEDPRAAEALDYFAYRIAREVGALTAALGGLDALVFTAGVGENSHGVRARVMDRLRWMGIAPVYAKGPAPVRLTQEDSRISAWSIPTNEELVLARHALTALAPDALAKQARRIE